MREFHFSSNNEPESEFLFSFFIRLAYFTAYQESQLLEPEPTATYTYLKNSMLLMSWNIIQLVGPNIVLASM